MSDDGWRSERLRKVIRDELIEDGAQAALNDAELQQVTEVAADAAWRWFVSTSLRTKPDFVEAMIAADAFDWEHAQPVDLQEYLADARQRRSTRRLEAGESG